MRVDVAVVAKSRDELKNELGSLENNIQNLSSDGEYDKIPALKENKRRY